MLKYAENIWKHLLDRLNVSYGELHHFFGPGVEESWVRMPWAPVSGATCRMLRNKKRLLISCKQDGPTTWQVDSSQVPGANWQTSPPTSLIGWVPARDLLLDFIETLQLYIEDFASIILLNLPASPSPMLRWFELWYFLFLPKFAKNIQFVNVTYRHTISPHMHLPRLAFGWFWLRWAFADEEWLDINGNGEVSRDELGTKACRIEKMSNLDWCTCTFLNAC